MKIHNNDLGAGHGGAIKHVISVLTPIVSGIEEIVHHRYASLETQVPVWEKRIHGRNSYGGINFQIDQYGFTNPENSFTKVVKTIRFGIRTDKEGYLDMDKLAAKFNKRLEEIREIMISNIKLDQERDQRREEWYKNIDVVQAMKEEGLIGADDVVEETECNFHFTMVFETEEELRDACKYYNGVRSARKEVEA